MLRGRVNWFRLLLAAIDVAIINLCLVMAFWLRFEGAIPSEYWLLYLHTAPAIALIFLVTAYAFGLYNRIWEYASLNAALVIPISITVSALIAGVLVTITEELTYPRSVAAMAWALSILAIGGSRFGWRLLRTKLYYNERTLREQQVRVLIYGAGHNGVMLARQADEDNDSKYKVIGFIDDNPRLRGMILSGHRVLGASEDIERLVHRHNIQEIIAALPPGATEALRQLLEQAKSLGIRVRTVPRLLELVNGQLPLTSVRDVSTADLLGRDAGDLEPILHADYISERTILVTGAGGSIGSEICRQLCRYHPSRVILLGRGENRIHSIYYELEERFPAIEFVPVICNLTSREAVEEVLRGYRPQVVLHAAAHKHVYLMEVNAVEAARNNILGTAILADLAEQYDVDRLIFVSTDKAAEPANVMGATKRFCERIVTHKNGSPSSTKFMAVRFGNVIGSSGSVLPIFQACVAQGRPITVTHPDVDRFFMTIEEAAFLVLQAGALNESGEVFLLDMGQPVKIVDLARAVLELNGRDPNDPKAIHFIGLRPGEKLHETLVASYEDLLPTACPRVLQVQANGRLPECTDLPEALADVRTAIANCDEAMLRNILSAATGASFHA
jgi:FlaA1/EpsC-like NDP-sugar epimerase